MSNRRRSGRRVLVLAIIASAVLWAVAGAGLVWTDTLGLGVRFEHLMDRVRLAVDPPPDRETVPTLDVVDIVLETSAPTGRSDGGLRPPSPTPRPERKPVDVKLRTKPASMFISQQTNDWCAPAGTQIVLAIHGVADNKPATQRALVGKTRKYESWRDSHNGGWGPAAISEALTDAGIEGYEVRAYRTRALALRDAAVALSRTRAPVVLIAWKGAHTWVMTGYRATADPTVFHNARITGTYIYDPWYPRVSTIWGASDPPGAFQDSAEMIRNYLPWQRPEGAYKDRDGKFLAVVPTIPLKDQRADR